MQATHAHTTYLYSYFNTCQNCEYHESTKPLYVNGVKFRDQISVFFFKFMIKVKLYIQLIISQCNAFENNIENFANVKMASTNWWLAVIKGITFNLICYLIST